MRQTGLDGRQITLLSMRSVLRYAHQFRGSEEAVPVLVVERRPNDPTWDDLRSALGVVLAWPDAFDEGFAGESGLRATAGV
jgi:hypothetical protein